MMTEEQMDALATNMTKCAVKYTDVTVMVQALVTVVGELKDSLEDEGILRHELKQSMTRLETKVISVSNKITDEMKANSKRWIGSYAYLYDELMQKIDGAVMLTGTERWLSLLCTFCRMIQDRLDYVHKHHHEFIEMESCKTIPALVSYTERIPSERHDLEPIIRPLLDSLVTKDEREQTKQKCLLALRQVQNTRPR